MTLIVSPLSQAEAVASARRASHVLSLLGPTLSPLDFAGLTLQRLHLTLNDVVEPGEGLILPAQQHVAALIDFGRTWDPSAPMLVHCWAGISRSTAAAYIMACDRLGPGCEDRIAGRLRQASPTARPNSLLIALADQALGRNGAMVSAITGIGPGEMAEAGTPFDLSLD